MKKIITLSILSIVLSLSLSASNLQSYFYYSTFNSPVDGPYIETYLTVVGNSSIFIKNANGKYQASTNVTMIFKIDNEIKKFEKYTFNSPEVADTLGMLPNFIDQQRISLPNGVYNLELQISDANSKSEPSKINEIITINYNNSDLNFSGIQFIESYKKTVEPNILSKSGYDLIPYVANLYPENIEKITFYTELYNSNIALKGDEIFLIKYYLEVFSNNKVLQDYNRFSKQTPQQVNVVLGELSIKDLPSGNYNLVIDVVDKDNRTIKTTKAFFYRSNPKKTIALRDLETIELNNTFVTNYNNYDTLAEYINYIFYISDAQERLFAKNQLKSANIEYMQKFFYNFWYNRNSVDPESAWLAYLKQIEIVNINYGSQIFKGYETDRGRIYLQYGAPNQILDSKHEPGALPYEIWHYYKLENQNNIRFVFYNSQIVGDNYELLHSNAKGEIRNENWKSIVNKGGSGSHGNKSDDLFNQ